MSNLVVSPYALSFDEIKTQLQSIISNSSAPEKWQDFYVSGAGETLLELDAAVALFLSFHAMMNRRETLLTVAKGRPAVVGLGESLGYNSSRGRNVYIDIEVVPTVPLNIEKWMVVGQYLSYDIIFMPTDGNSMLLTPNTINTLRCVIGNVETQRINIVNSLPQQFTFTSPNVTDDFRILLNSNEVPVSSELKDTLNDNYIALTNSFGAVDVFYNNLNVDGKYKYTTGDSLYLHYIARNDLTYSSISSSYLVMFNADRIENFYIYSDKSNEEDINSIKVNAPIYHETNNIVRARKDFAKLLKQLGKNIFDETGGNSIIDVNDWDVSPGLIALTYLKQNKNNGELTLFTEEEKNSFISEIDKCTPDGVTRAIIIDPVPVLREITINVKSRKDVSFETTFLMDLDEILGEYTNKLGADINLDDIEHSIERLPGVKTARLNFGISNYQTNTNYKRYDKITVPNILVGNDYETWTFRASGIVPKSGIVEPDWSSARNNGDILIDKNFIWKNNKKTYSENIIGEWEPNKNYDLFTDIKPVYTVESNCTLPTEPRWGNVVIKDGNVTWNRIKFYPKYNDGEDFEENSMYPYEHDTFYEVATEDNKGYFSKVCVEEDDFRGIYNCVQTEIKTGKEEPNWDVSGRSDNYVMDNTITWEKEYIELIPERTYHVGDTFAVIIDNNLAIYEVSNVTGTGKVKENYVLIDDVISQQTVPFGTSHIIIYSVDSGNQTYISIDRINENGALWTSSDREIPVKEYETETKYDVGDYVNKNNGFYAVISNSNTKSGSSAIFTGEQVVKDNAITWNVESVTVGENEVYLFGKTWKPSSVYDVDDIIIVSDDNYYYVYQCLVSKNVKIIEKNTAFTLIGYAGTSGEDPNWYYTTTSENEVITTHYYNTVIDNEILWTKTKEESVIDWESNTSYSLGTIIRIRSNSDEDYSYYKFSSLVGKSGENEPEWIDIEGGLIEDGNIVWKRIDDDNQIKLGWNEYLILDYRVTWN